jgi:hypothetical protein
MKQDQSLRILLIPNNILVSFSLGLPDALASAMQVVTCGEAMKVHLRKL